MHTTCATNHAGLSPAGAAAARRRHHHMPLCEDRRRGSTSETGLRPAIPRLLRLGFRGKWTSGSKRRIMAYVL